MNNEKDYMIIWSDIFEQWCAINLITKQIEYRDESEDKLIAQIEGGITHETSNEIL